MTTEEIHTFNIDNTNIKIIKDCTYFGLVINANGGCHQKNQENAETQRGSNGRIRKHHKEQRCVIKNQGKTIHTLVFPITMYGYESWTVKDGWKSNLFEL